MNRTITPSPLPIGAACSRHGDAHVLATYAAEVPHRKTRALLALSPECFFGCGVHAAQTGTHQRVTLECGTH